MSDKYKKIPQGVKIFGSIASIKTIHEAFKDPNDYNKSIEAISTILPFGSSKAIKLERLKETGGILEKGKNDVENSTKTITEMENKGVSINLDYAPTKEKLKEATLNENEKH